MYRLGLFILCSLFSLVLLAQDSFIRGVVVDDQTNEPLQFATVAIVSLNVGVDTDEEGKFELIMSPDIYNVQASFTGYETLVIHEILLTSANPEKIEFRLRKTNTELSTATVTGESFRNTAETATGVQKVSALEVEQLAGATMDISKFIKALPGVSTQVSFGYSQIVRGGASIENRFYLDGIEIPAITHFNVQGTSGGPNGLINTRLIEKAEMYNGAFPAFAPNALSSVLMIDQRVGRTDHFSGSFTLGATDWGFYLEGPMGKKSSYVFSARESYSQHYLKAIGVPVVPTYSDVQYKQKIQFDTKNELTIVGLGSYDKYELNLDADPTEGLLYNVGFIPEGRQFLYTGGLSYKHYLDNKSVYNVVLSQNYFYNKAEKFVGNTGLEEDRTLAFKSVERETKARFQHKYFIDGGSFAYGLNVEKDNVKTDNYSFHTFRDGSVDSIIYNRDLDIFRYGAYGSFENNLLDGALKYSVGVRLDANNYNDLMKNPLKQISPRIGASWAFAPDWTLNFGSGIYYQVPPYLMLSFQSEPNGTQIHDLKYMRNKQLNLGAEYTSARGCQVKLEGFYKQYDQYPFMLFDSISYANANASYAFVGNQPANSTSEGEAYGLEFSIRQKLKSNWFWMANATFVVSQFDDNNGNLVSSAWDNRIFGNIALSRKFKKGWQIGGRFSFSGGNPYSPYDHELSSQIPIWDLNQRGLFDFDQLNEERLPFFHRMDVRVDKRFNYKKWTLSTYIDVQNVYASGVQFVPYLTVDRDSQGDPLVDISNPDAYSTKLINSDSGRVLPTIGLIIEF